MCQIVEARTEEEMNAAEALLTLAGFWARVQRNVLSTMSIPIASAIVPKTQLAIITSTPQPGKRPRHVSFNENETRKSVISVDHNGQVKENEKSESSTEKKVSTPKIMKITSPIPSLSSKSKSGRVVKRPRRFISQSDEENQSPNPMKKRTPGKKVAQKPSEEKKAVAEKKPIKEVTQKDPEEIHPAKKMKISAAPVQKMINVLNSETLKGRFVDIFSKNVKKVIQPELLRHSRLFETAYELQHCNKLDTLVDSQHRAAENLELYKDVVEEIRNEALSHRSALMNKWMKKFRALKNREQICNDFNAKFKSTTSKQWKPFTEDAARLSDVSNYKLLQVMRKPLIQCLVDEFVKKNLTKEKARSTLIAILKLLPDRPEVRYEFIYVYLPKMIAANKTSYKATNKKGNRNNLKKETAVNPAFQAYF